MDVFSHGLWGGVLFGRESRLFFFFAVLFGILPDILSFGIYFLAILLGFGYSIDWSAGPPPMESIPSYVHTLYNISHSLITFAIIFFLIWLIRKKPFLPFLAYGFAVFLDIPTHTADFFPTPFLWPISDFTVSGVNWGIPSVFLTNIILLIGAYTLWYFVSRKKREAD